MLKKILFLIFIHCCLYNVQAGRIDSLETLLAEKSDTLRIPVLHELVVANINSSASNSILYGLEALELSEKCKERQKKADALIDLSIAYSFVSDYSKAADFLIEALNIQNDIGDSTGIAYSYNNLGAAYGKLGDYEKALQYHKESYKIKIMLKDTAGMAASLNNIGLIYFEHLKDYDKAEENILQAEKLHRNIGQYYGICMSYANLSRIYDLQADYDKALEYGKFALGLAKDSGFIGMIIRIEAELGDVYINLNDFHEAKKRYETSLHYAEQENSIYNMMNSYYKLSIISEELDSNILALNYLKKYIEIKDKINDSDIKKKISEVEAHYRIDLLNQENELLKSENKLIAASQREQYIYFVAGGIVALIFFLFLIFRYRSNRKALNAVNKKSEIIEEMNNELLRLNKESNDRKEELLKLLEEISERERRLKQFIVIKDIFNSVLSRDIRNPLQSIILDSYMLMKNQKTMQPEVRDNHILSINNSINQIVELLDNLMQWDKIRIGDINYLPVEVNVRKMADDIVNTITNKLGNRNIELINSVEDNCLVFADFNMLYYILKNIIWNSVNFSEKGKIRIKSSEYNNQICIEVSDNGSQMIDDAFAILNNPDDHNITFVNKSVRGKGIDLVVSNEYTKLLNGSFEFSNNEPQGVIFKINLPKRNMNID